MIDNTNDNIKSESEAMDYLVRQAADKETKDRWKKEFSISESDDKIEEKKSFKLLSMLTGLAASILLGVFMFNSFYSSGNLDSMVSHQLASTIVDLDEVTRGDSDGLPENFKEAYKAKNFSKASSILGSTDINSSKEKFFYAISLSKSSGENNTQVISLLTDVLSFKDVYYTEALWFKALVELKEGQLEQARKDLNELNNRKYKTDIVYELLEKI